jgi:hypothetical protein
VIDVKSRRPDEVIEPGLLISGVTFVRVVRRSVFLSDMSKSTARTAKLLSASFVSVYTDVQACYLYDLQSRVLSN